MVKVKKPAIKKGTGKVISLHLPNHHKDVASLDKRKGGDGKGQRGFVLSDGSFAGRQKAKSVAKKAGQATVKGKRGLHSEDLI